MKQQIIVIVGPNASGKTSLSIKIAKKINGEIISADSRQVYKGLDIGSGKVTKMEMHGIQHHCLSIANPKKIFSALDFKNRAERAIVDILSRGKTPIIVGGTGFYIDAALGRMKLGGVPTNPKLRKKLSHYSLAKLNATLAKLDPERARTVEQKNPVRLIRAIEIIKAKKADKNSILILGKIGNKKRIEVARIAKEKNLKIIKVEMGSLFNDWAMFFKKVDYPLIIITM